MTTPTKIRVAPDESHRAEDIIEVWLALDPEAQNEQLARLIASAINPGPGSELDRFASTGQLDAPAAMDELNDIRVPMEREGWIDALGRYLLNTGGSR